jgi:glycosyltransferase involved in cell wall biosynthesis
LDISIIICTYNRSQSLINTLASIRQLTVPSEMKWELIIVNNNSLDDTEKVIKAFINDSPCTVQYCFEGAQGLSYARNHGVKKASGKFIAFTDDDVMVEPDWALNIYNAFQEHDDLWCVGGKIKPIWSMPRPSWLCDRLLTPLAMLDLGDEIKCLLTPTLWGANIAFRAEVFDRYGFFDEALGRTKDKLYAGEETALTASLIEDGKKVLYYPLAVVHHAVEMDRINKRYFRKWYFDGGELKGYTRPFKGKYFIIPLSPLREAVIYLSKMVFSRKNGEDNDRFIFQLMALDNLGAIWGSLEKRLYIGYIS